MNEKDIRILWNILYFKQERSANVCRALEESLILPSRPQYLISSGAYGTSVLLQSGKVAKVVPVAKGLSPKVVEQRYPDVGNITPLEEAQYEAYMMHYVSKHRIAQAPTLYRFNVVEAHQQRESMVLHRWAKNQDPKAAPPLGTLSLYGPGATRDIQLAVFIMSRAKGHTLNTVLRKAMEDGPPSAETIHESAIIVADCLSRIAEMHSKRVVHGDCHTKNILYEKESDSFTFIDWARAMRQIDFDPDVVHLMWETMCTYDFAQFLASVFQAVGPDCYKKLLREMSTQQLIDESFGVHQLLSKRWIEDPFRRFQTLIDVMFSSLETVQSNSRRKERREKDLRLGSWKSGKFFVRKD